MSSGTYARVLWFTTWQAGVSTLLTLAVALPGAHVFARYRFPGKNLLLSLTAVPFVLPSVVVAAGFQALLGGRGLVNTWLVDALNLAGPPIALDHTIWFILLAHVFYNYAVVVRIVGGFWARLQPVIAEAAKTLGASPWRIFSEITLPLIMPAVLAASMLVFIFCFSSFGVILILGGPRFSTIEVEIYRQAVHLFNLPMAAVLSLLQILLTLGFMGVYGALQRSTTLPVYPESRAVTERRITSCRDWFILSANGCIILSLLCAPLAALVVRSFQSRQGLTLDFYRYLFWHHDQSLFPIAPIDATLYSIGFALATLVLSVAIALPAALILAQKNSRTARFLDPVLMLPLATSAVTLGFGFIVALDEPPLNLRTSLALVPLAHTLVAYPFVVRSILPALRSIPPSLKEAAAMLGGSPLQVFLKVVVPIVSRAVMVGAVFAFTISIGEFGATVFVARPQTPTMTLAIYRFLGQPGEMNYGCAMAMSTILMAVTVAGFLVLDRIRLSKEGEI
ncbi:MAG: iron ABC transporter permease [Desulfobacterota bacterium]|nr:iron ABC transporter permease [Thermodesulfobacteriota bacterium]